MKTTKTRAFTLIHILAMLPLIAVATAMASQLFVRTMRIPRLELEYMTRNNAIRHLVKRVRGDAMLANGIELRQDDAGQRLRMILPDKEVVYEIGDDHVTRTVSIDAQEESRSRRSLEKVRISFELETIRDASVVLWIVIAPQPRVADGWTPELFCAAAAHIGRGG